MSSSKQTNISASDKALITDLDKQIRNYVLEYGTPKDSELLNQAISDIGQYHENQERK